MSNDLPQGKYTEAEDASEDFCQLISYDSSLMSSTCLHNCLGLFTYINTATTEKNNSGKSKKHKCHIVTKNAVIYIRLKLSTGACLEDQIGRAHV